MAHRAHILIVEDEPLVSTTLASALEDQFTVNVAASAAQAEDALARQQFSAVLLDCLLPGGGVANVMDSADQHGIPVILMSGAPEQINALSGGQRPFVSKPFAIRELIEILRSVIG